MLLSLVFLLNNISSTMPPSSAQPLIGNGHALAPPTTHHPLTPSTAHRRPLGPAPPRRPPIRGRKRPGSSPLPPPTGLSPSPQAPPTAAPLAPPPTPASTNQGGPTDCEALLLSHLTVTFVVCVVFFCSFFFLSGTPGARSLASSLRDLHSTVALSIR